MEGHCGEADLNPTGVAYIVRIGQGLVNACLYVTQATKGAGISPREGCVEIKFLWMLETEIVLEQVGQTWQNAEVNELDKYVDMEPVQNGRASKMEITRVIKVKNIKPYKTSRLMFFFELQVDENVLFILEVVVAKQVLHKTSLMDCDMCVNCHLRTPGVHFALMAPVLHRLPPATSDS